MGIDSQNSSEFWEFNLKLPSCLRRLLEEQWMRSQAGFALAFHDYLGESLFFHQGVVVAGCGVVDTDVHHDLCTGVGNAVRPVPWDVGDRARLPRLRPELAVQSVQQQVTASSNADVHLRLILLLVQVALRHVILIPDLSREEARDGDRHI